MKPPELVSATQEELDEILALTKKTLPAKQYQLLEGVLGTFGYVMRALQNAKTSVKRFRQMQFGASTESKHKLFKDLDVASAADAAPLAGATTPTSGEHGENPPPAKPGHGRNGAQAYSDSPVVGIDLPDLKSGDQCPKCTDGRVYDTPPKVVVKVVGSTTITAVLGDEVQFGIDGLSTTRPHWRAGKVRVYGITIAQRASVAPEIPSLAELGVQGFDVSLWQSLVAPSGVPEHILARLHLEFSKAMQSEDVRKKLAPLGIEPLSISRQQFASRLQAESEKWRSLVTDIGMPLLD